MPKERNKGNERKSVRLVNIKKEFSGGVKAVDNVSLEVEPGKFAVLVGPSGCGKTTALRLVAGLEKLDAGEIYIGDRLINDVPPSQRNVAMVFQNLALYPHMSVYQNIVYALKIMKISKSERDRKVREVAKLLEISELLDRNPAQISGGQQQRVALGRELVKDPEVFLFDEPLSSLDAKVRRQMRTEIAKIHHELQNTVIYVTHDQAEALALGDKLVVMNNGQVYQTGSPAEVYRNPQNIFVAGFLGSPTMNFLEGILKPEGDSIFFTTNGFEINIPRTDLKNLREDQEIVLGIRPRYIKMHTKKNSSAYLEATVNTVELLGEEVEINLTCQSQELIALVGEEKKFEVGDSVFVELNNQKIHFFDKETGSTLI